MNRTQKQDAVAALVQKLENSPSLYLTDFTGITVKAMTDLRRKFRAEGLEFVVVKNSLVTRAFEQASVEGLNDQLNGPTGLVFAGADGLSAAKVITEFQKEQEDRLAIKVGLIDGKTVGADEVKKLASLPSREELLAQLAGAMQAPMAGFVSAMDSLLYQFVGSLEALRSKGEDAS
jgi:large subunit ribosomal protein L10